MLRGHAGPAWAARSARRHPAVSAGDDRTARVWDLGTGASTVLRHPAVVTRADFSPDGRGSRPPRRTASSGSGTSTAGRRVASGPTSSSHLRALRRGRASPRHGRRGRRGALVVGARGPAARGAAGPPRPCSRPPSCPGTDTVVSGGEDGMLRVWTRPPARDHARPGHRRELAPDGRRVVSGGEDGALGSGTPRPERSRCCRAHQGPELRPVLPRRRAGVSASHDGTVRISDCRRRPLRVVPPARPPVAAPSIPRGTGSPSPAGSRRIVVQHRPPAAVRLRGHRAFVRDVAFSPDAARRQRVRRRHRARLESGRGPLERTLARSRPVGQLRRLQR